MATINVNPTFKAPSPQQSIAALIIILVILQGFGFLLFDIVKVNDRQVAVITRFGKAVSTVQGWGIKTPWIDTHAVTYDTSVQSISVNANCATSDQQTLTIKVNVQYRLDGSKALDIYRLVQNQQFLNEAIIPPFIQEAIKASTAKFTASELLNKRDLVKTEVETALGNRLREYYSSVVAVNIENIDWSDAYEKAIESKVVAQQDAERAKQVQEKARIDAETTLIQAKAEADATRVRGEALRLNPETLEKAKIDKWDGKLPQVTGSGSQIINLK